MSEAALYVHIFAICLFFFIFARQAGEDEDLPRNNILDNMCFGDLYRLLY